MRRGTESKKQCPLLYLGPRKVKHDFSFPALRSTHVAEPMISAADSKPWETLLRGSHRRWRPGSSKHVQKFTSKKWRHMVRHFPKDFHFIKMSSQ